MSKQPSVGDIFKFIDQIAPFETAESWDNVGLIVGSTYDSASKILLALDITEAVVDEAIKGQYKLIITHHPMIFSGVKAITYEGRLGNMLIKLITHKISVIAAHTNLDRSFKYGINRMIATHYHLEALQPLSTVHSFGIFGNLPEPMAFDTFIEQTKVIFDIKTVKVSNAMSDDKLIRTVAISSGASSDYISDAITVKADVYITADLKYHEAQKVIDTGLILVDVGHFESERLFVKPFKVMLDNFAIENGFQLVVHVTETEKPIFNYL